MNCLENMLVTAARTKGVSVRVDSQNESTLLVDIDSGFSGNMAFTLDQKDKNTIYCSAKSYKMGGDYRIRDALAKAGISSEVVPSGPEGYSNEVKFTVPYTAFENYEAFEKAVDAVYTTFKKMESNGV